MEEGLDLLKKTLTSVVSHDKHNTKCNGTTRPCSRRSLKSIFVLHITFNGKQSSTPSMSMADTIVEQFAGDIFSMVAEFDPRSDEVNLVESVGTHVASMKIPDNALLVCIAHTNESVSQQVTGLGAVLHSLIGSAGMIFSCLQSKENNNGQTIIDPTQVIFEFAEEGINPDCESNFTHHFHTDGGFAAYFHKQDVVFRTPLVDDLEVMCSMDQDSWEENLCYPRDLLQAWIQNHPKDIILMFAKNSNKVSSPVALGAIYTRQIQDTGSIDSKPWKKSIFEISGVVKDTQSETSEKGMVKQLLRVSTKSGGKEVNASSYLPGNSLRDFALIVSASQGCDKVVRIYLQYFSLLSHLCRLANSINYFINSAQ